MATLPPSIEDRVTKLESYMADHSTRLTRLEADQSAIKDNTDEILEWIKGAKTVWGFTLGHWRSILKFGMGFALATGYLSPNVHDYITAFFGVAK